MLQKTAWRKLLKSFANLIWAHCFKAWARSCEFAKSKCGNFVLQTNKLWLQKSIADETPIEYYNNAEYAIPLCIAQRRGGKTWSSESCNLTSPPLLGHPHSLGTGKSMHPREHCWWGQLRLMQAFLKFSDPATLLVHDHTSLKHSPKLHWMCTDHNTILLSQ